MNKYRRLNSFLYKRDKKYKMMIKINNKLRINNYHKKQI